jgi:hypothetical protein
MKSSPMQFDKWPSMSSGDTMSLCYGFESDETWVQSAWGEVIQPC